MKKILTVVGARPQIIKSAAVSRAVKRRFPESIDERILHTGQHYDVNMSKVFFDELGIPEPHYNLGVGSGRHGEQTAGMTAGIEQVLQSEHFDGIILYGDTNSTLAGAVAAAKMGIPVFHIEAGLRSYNMSMPEEQNRIVCDHLSSILFAPTQTAVDNLKKEGLTCSPATFPNGKGRLVIDSGDVMYDNCRHFLPVAEEHSAIMKENGLCSKEFILATIHRPVNTDSPERLTSIFRALLDLDRTVILPLHPRTAKLLSRNLRGDILEEVRNSGKIKILPPASFFDIMVLEKNARLVVTDSGGVQKEAFFLQTPTVILREETEWVEIVQHGAGILADADYDRIISAYHSLCGRPVNFPLIFGDGHAAERILESLIEYLD